jgi:hypothetical protein
VRRPGKLKGHTELGSLWIRDRKREDGIYGAIWKRIIEVGIHLGKTLTAKLSGFLVFKSPLFTKLLPESYTVYRYRRQAW